MQTKERLCVRLFVLLNKQIEWQRTATAEKEIYMALTRKQLSAMGIEAEKIEQIIEAHTETVSGLKDEMAKLEGQLADAKAEAGKLTDVQKELDTLKAQVAKDEKAREGKDYDALKQEFEDYKAEVKRKAERAAKEEAYKSILKDAGIPERHFAKILKYSDVDGVELDDKGEITTKKEILKAVKDEWGDHIATEEKQGAESHTPPAGGKPTKTKEEIMQIKDSAERQKAIAENATLFGLN